VKVEPRWLGPARSLGSHSGFEPRSASTRRSGREPSGPHYRSCDGHRPNDRFPNRKPTFGEGAANDRSWPSPAGRPIRAPEAGIDPTLAFTFIEASGRFRIAERTPQARRSPGAAPVGSMLCFLICERTMPGQFVHVASTARSIGADSWPSVLGGTLSIWSPITWKAPGKRNLTRLQIAHAPLIEKL